ncbi:tetratricopeptide repeat protein [Paraburkholderia aspalathi]|uniref:tetratricopeptide repeat protein n=1 Tax=Paraburkholderia aspalathi TaxID=1324617 RepID=UPI0038BB4797
MTESAEGGYAPAQYNVGVFCESGLFGLSRDVDRALEWFRTAAAQDYAPAQFKVGACFQRGIGVPPDLTVAAHWLFLSAQGGYLKAKVNLGYLYMTGMGVAHEDRRAAELFTEAALGGNVGEASARRGARYRLAEVGGELGLCVFAMAVGQPLREGCWYRDRPDRSDRVVPKGR